MSTPISYRQGDVLVVAVDAVPDSARPVPRDAGRIVLAYGEVTGHAHAIDAPEAEAMLLSVSENERFLRLMADVDLAHEEHAAIRIPAGTYRVVRQRIWDDRQADAEEDAWLYAGD
jgi:hypothetical protein